MPLILVVEQEKRYVERIEEALEPQGWEVVGVDDRAAAMRLVADRAADLVVVNSEVDESSELVSAFARANGGPGAVVLVPESDNGSVPPESDEVLRKPFTDQDLRLAVRRCLSATRDAEAVETVEPASDVKFSSEDIFGDVVLELEGAFNLSGAEADAEDEAVAPSEPAETEPADEPAGEEFVAEEAAAVEAADQVAEEATAEPEQEKAVDSPDISDEVEEAFEGLEARPQAAVEEDVAEAAEVEAVEVELEEAAQEEPAEAEPAEESEDEETVEDEMGEETQVDEELADGDEASEGEAAEGVEDEVEEAEAEEEAEAVAVAEEQAEPSPGKPKKKLLEERLHEALAEGKALASEEKPVAAPPNVAESTDLLLQKALATLSADTRKAARIDDEFAAPAHATAEEVDALVGTIVGKKKPVFDPPPPGEAGQTAGAEPLGTMERVEDGEDAASLDVTEVDYLDSDESAYKTRMKILWLVILVLVAALVVFVLTRPSSDEAAEPTSAPESVDQSLNVPSGPGDAAEATEGEFAEPTTGDDMEEDGDGAAAPTS